jgi:hypothetical protein
MRPVPAEYGPGKPAPFELRLRDSLGRTYSTHAFATVHRSAKIREMHVGRGSLFEREGSSSPTAYRQREASVLPDFSAGEFSVES